MKSITRAGFFWLLAGAIIGFGAILATTAANKLPGAFAGPAQREVSLRAPVAPRSNQVIVGRDCDAFLPQGLRVVRNQPPRKPVLLYYPYFSQVDFRYTSTRYGSNSRGAATIGSSGCGPASAAIVLRHFLKCVDPVTIAKFSLDNGYRINNVGTSARLFSALARKYGLEYRSVERGTQEAKWRFVFSWLAAGYPVIASMDNDMFSSGGHYIVLVGFSPRGGVLIADPGPDNLRVAPQNIVKARIKHAHVLVGGERLGE